MHVFNGNIEAFDINFDQNKYKNTDSGDTLAHEVHVHMYIVYTRMYM